MAREEIPLSIAKAGKKFKICRILGGRNVLSRLASLGLYPGVEIELICGSCNAPCIVRVNNSKLSLGEGVAQKILVKEV